MSKDNIKHSRKMRLWNPADRISDEPLKEGDEYSICEQFFRKTNSIENEVVYIPDISKDYVMSNAYSYEPFDFYEFCNRDHCIETLKCLRLRMQVFELLEYARNE
ncbi:uncharacterized protein VICG_02148, partial [Vittaforma corneae ATCC 50505]